jgi:hypothetical protein
LRPPQPDMLISGFGNSSVGNSIEVAILLQRARTELDLESASLYSVG